LRLSAKPGTTARPPTSITSVLGPRKRSRSFVLPTATMVEPRIATRGPARKSWPPSST
jgi:hypothetical protein